MKQKKVLTVDDDLTFLNSLEKVLVTLGFSVEKENVSTKVIERVTSNGFDVILLDIKMPGLNGIELLEKILSHDPTLPIIIISGQSTINIAVEAMKLGAFDFVEKPIDKKRIETVLKNAVKYRNLSKENLFLSKEIAKNFEMIGESDAMLQIYDRINITAKTDAKVLITGETGTGKELVARAIHMHSNRAKEPYIKVNCAAIPSELLESELFGHKRGSFTGATNNKIGKFKAANRGTLFLDEIGDLNYNLQAKILRVLEEGEIEVIGETKAQKVDVRVIAATNKILSKEIEAGSFRADLFHRLNIVEIHIPPLRERKDDIKPLVYNFLTQFNSVYNKSIIGISDNAVAVLQRSNWEGNIRQLKNFVQKLVIYSKNNTIETKDVLSLFDNSADITNGKILELKEAKHNFERNFIKNALLVNDGKIIETAKALGMDRSHLFKKMKQLEIEKHGL